VEKLSRERPLGNIFNFYVLLSVLMQFALHIGSMIYITELAHGLEEYVIVATPLSYDPLLTILNQPWSYRPGSQVRGELAKHSCVLTRALSASIDICY
jgi:hypothetical protein